MRHLIRVLMLSVLSASAVAQTAQTAVEPPLDLQSIARVFDYDAKQSLDIHDKIIEEFSGGTLHDITYMSPKGGPVGGYLVVPKGKGPFPAAP